MLAIAAAKRNLKAVVIDADLEAPSLMHLLHPQKVAPTWVDYLEEYVNDITELPQKTNIPNLEVIYSPTPQVGKNFLGWKSKAWWQQALKRSMIAEQELHQAGYDFVVLDNQSGTSLNSVNNMVLADASVMVIRPATYGVGAAENFIGEMYRVLRNINVSSLKKHETSKRFLHVESSSNPKIGARKRYTEQFPDNLGQ
jgi:MinD-like ATPase involved in chromosome partitioning or flagellar assembly